jgi:outer membrane protein OmpA-like peptidoglycan-associated protein/Flp pilus assembly protein TadD
MNRLFFIPLVFAPLVFGTACASSGGYPAKGSVSPKTGGIDRKVVNKEELAALLNDNPVSLARRAKDGKDDTQVAKKGPNGEDLDGGKGGGPGDDEPAAPDADPLMKKAQAALEAKDYAAAEKYAKQVVAIDPKGYPYAYVILGDVALEQKKYEEALGYYKKAIELDPKDGWAAQRAAQVYQKLGRANEARGVLRKHVMSNPDADADTWDALAWLELDLGDMKAAEAAFQKAIEASGGKDAEAWYGLAMIAARRGDPKATEKALTALFDLEPERRLVIERDPTFFRMRIHANVKALFDSKKMAEAKIAAEKKKKGETVATKTPTYNSSTKLSIPGGPETSIADQIHFEFDSAAISDGSKATLDEIATFLKAQKGIEFVEITGHADRRGEEAYNIKLSESRAQAVRTALVLRGVPATILRAKGYGVYCPLDDGDDESAFAKNRRVQFAIGAGGQVLGEELACQDRMRKWLKPGKSVKLTAAK